MTDRTAAAALVTLDAVPESDAPLLASLLELYARELAPVFPNVRIGEDGRFGYSRLPLYWSEPERRFPFFIRREGRLAGFALASRGCEDPADPTLHDVAEFYVLDAERRAGLGRLAAHALWDRLPGRWMVRVSENHRAAHSFWQRTIDAYVGRELAPTIRPGEPHAWRVYRFGD